MITRKSLNQFPSKTGIYIFKQKKQPLYVGKSVNIKARLISHYENAQFGGKEKSIIDLSDKIDFILTDSEFKALLLESELIQKYRPKYNSRWKDNKSYLYIEITGEEYPKIFLARKTEIDTNSKNLYYGPFSSVKTVESLLRSIRKIFPYCGQKKIGIAPCFYSKIGLCKPCPNDITHLRQNYSGQGGLRIKLKKQYRKNIREIIKTLEGKTDSVVKDLTNKLKLLINEEKYEEALVLRNKLHSFSNLINNQGFYSEEGQYNRSAEMLNNLFELLKKYIDISKLHRIEAYDMSDLTQKDATGSMVVFIDGQSDKSQYRKFKIKSKFSVSDTKRFEEVITRRFKNKWDEPDLIIVDGGRPQVMTVKTILAKLNKKIPIVGIAKNPDRLVILENHILKTLRLSLNSLGFNLVRAIRDESHRFARKYHLELRGRKMV